MIQLTPQMRILVAVDPVDFRRGIDGLCRVCRDALGADPVSGTVFVFRSRRGTAIKILAYDGQGFWLAQKRLSEGRFRYWPHGQADAPAVRQLFAHQIQVLIAAGNPEGTQAAPQWRPVSPGVTA
jgi:transposase